MRFLRRLKTLLQRNRVDDEIRREMAFHVEMEAAERARRGEQAGDAHRIARADFGAVAAVREDVRDARGLTFWDHLVQDVRFGVRLLGRQPGFTAVAVTILALGIGVNTAVFSIVNTLVLKPRPWHAEGEIVGVHSKDTSLPDSYRAFSYADYLELRGRTDLFSSLTAHNMALVGVADGDRTRRVIADIVTANYFDTFGSPLTAGRAFTIEEERPGAEIPVTILSYPAWQRMGGRTDIIGQTIRLNTRPFQIVGVAGRGFGGSLAFVTPELWLPTGVYDTITNDFFRGDPSTNLGDSSNYSLILMARLPVGRTAAALEPALEVASASMAKANPAANAHRLITLAPLGRMSISTKPSTDIAAIAGLTVALLSMAAVVLLVASFNLANMLLARSGSRRKEFAIRLAIGGSRGRVVRQLMTEGLILALVGGAAGLAIAIWSTQLLVATLSRVAPVSFTFEAMPDWRILSAMIGYCTLSTVVFGLLPARRLAGTDPGLALKGNAGELVTGRRFRLGLPNLFVMGQLALSLVLISVAALFLRGATEAAKADPGFSLDRGIMVQMDPSLGGLTAARSREVYQLALDRLRARPDVAAASVASIIPFGDLEDDVDMQRAGAPIRRGDANAATDLVEDSTLTSIGAGYFDALGLTVRSGREFTEDEERASGPPRVAIIDLGLAERLFGTASAVGRQVQYAPRGEGEPIVMTVVGVAPGIRQNMFATSPEPHVYVPFGSAFVSGAILHVRTRATSAAAEQSMLPGIRQLIADIDARVPVLEAQTLASYRDRNLLLGVVRAGAATFTVFGVVALLMAAVGVYGVKAYVVSRRTREIGIRVALGATARRVVWIIVRDGLTASVVGLGVGLVLSALVGIAMRSLTYQGRAADAAVLTVALVVLTSSALLASWLPARRATKIEPLRAIRE